MTASVLFHVQYLLGIGHLQRSLRIAEALARLGIVVTFVSGGAPVPTLALARPGIRVVQLPAISALDARFELINAATGQPLDDTLRQVRRTALLDAFAAARPDAIVIEGFPFARRAFRFELDPLISAATAAPRHVPVICSVRDIVSVRDNPTRHAEIAARVRADFDAVLVHGDPRLIPFEASFHSVANIAHRLTYTGYVTEPQNFGATLAEQESTGEVLVSGGGGPAGYALMQTAIEARRRGYLADAPWRLLTGATLSSDRFDALAYGAPAGVTVDRFRADFTVLLRRCLVSVSQAGYNTALDLLAARARAVLVPFAAERETEQSLRAKRLAALGVAELVRESELTPERLGRAVEIAAARPPAAISVNMAGAETSARLIAEMIDAGGSEILPPTAASV
jgi:predicted glycosyltransferase